MPLPCVQPTNSMEKKYVVSWTGRLPAFWILRQPAEEGVGPGYQYRF